uniref:Costars domain-containing protein n=1 Tax=Meloidogyne hapla TaxID=6305 RepID=A0A1I8BVB9_MELHA
MIQRRIKGPTTLTLSFTIESAQNVQRALQRMREKEQRAIDDRANDVYSKNYIPRKYSKNSLEYGKPPPGSLTEMRAKKAAKHIAKEMLQLCEIIEEYGNKINGEKIITFGHLFNIYEYISDKVVGILLRARKHGMVDFDGEMLFQRRDENKIIKLLLSNEKIKECLKEF